MLVELPDHLGSPMVIKRALLGHISGRKLTSKKTKQNFTFFGPLKTCLFGLWAPQQRDSSLVGADDVEQVKVARQQREQPASGVSTETPTLVCRSHLRLFTCLLNFSEWNCPTSWTLVRTLSYIGQLTDFLLKAPHIFFPFSRHCANKIGQQISSSHWFSCLASFLYICSPKWTIMHKHHGPVPIASNLDQWTNGFKNQLSLLEFPCLPNFNSSSISWPMKINFSHIDVLHTYFISTPSQTSNT